MGKHYVISILISITLVATFVAAMFLIMLPQVEHLSSEVIDNYTRIDIKDFEFVETKHFVTEILSTAYTISQDDINEFKNSNLYKAGNSDPFTPKDTLTSATNNSTQENAQNQNNNSSNSGEPITGTTK